MRIYPECAGALFFEKCKRLHEGQKYMKQNIVIVYVLLSVFLAGCETTPPSAKAILPPVVGMPGVYHRIEKGQTLWKISRIYNTDIDDIARINHVDDSGNIELGQVLFIPNVRKAAPTSNVNYEEFIWPLKGKITCSFGQTFNDMLNKGLNIQPAGNYNVLASRSGKIVFLSDNFGIYGKTVIIDHADGLSTVYSGNLRLCIKIGDSVQKGDIIARDDGSLHFEIRKGYQAQNPLFYLP